MISRAGKPIARLIPISGPKRPRTLGRYRGQIWIADDFDAALPPDLQAAFDGESD